MGTHNTTESNGTNTNKSSQSQQQQQHLDKRKKKSSSKPTQQRGSTFLSCLLHEIKWNRGIRHGRAFHSRCDRVIRSERSVAKKLRPYSVSQFPPSLMHKHTTRCMFFGTKRQSLALHGAKGEQLFEKWHRSRSMRTRR